MPESLKDLISGAQQMGPAASGVLLAMVMSFLRRVYNKEEGRLTCRAQEALICGGLCLTLNFAFGALGMDPNWTAFAGGIIGYFGSKTVRGLVLKAVNKRIDEQ